MIRKSTLILAVAAAVLFIGMGCDGVVTLDKPTVTAAAITPGTTLRLQWTAVTDAESYQITTDDSVYTTTSESFDVTAPTKTIEVRAVNGNDKSDPATIDCKVKETSSIVLYGISDPNADHPSGLAFTGEGVASPLSLSDANKPNIDYVCDDENISPVGLVNAGDYGWPGNTKVNTAMDAGSTDYDAFKQAATSGYSSQTTIASNGLYTLWVSNSQGWTVNDHFAKAKIVSIEDVGGVQKVTLKVGYQKIGGLRWLMN